MNTKETRKAIRNQLKQEFPNCKFSVVGKSASMCQETIIALVSAPFEVFSSGDDSDCTRYTNRAKETGYAQLNHYQLSGSVFTRDHACNGVYLTLKAWEVMQRAVEIAEEIEEYDKRMKFLAVEIGKWNKPFILKKA